MLETQYERKIKVHIYNHIPSSMIMRFSIKLACNIKILRNKNITEGVLSLF